MTTQQPQMRGLYFEDFTVGMSILSPGRTITESDIVTFAGLSGDFNQIHTDAEYSQSTPFGQRVAHGLLGLSIASGLAVRTGVIEGTVLAWREINEWKFVNPLLIGDTIHVVMQVVETKGLRGTGGGAVTIEVRVVNQNDQVVMKGTWKMLVMSRG
jgi:acyl dehydratase